MPQEGISKKEHEQILSLEEIFQIVKVSTKLGISKVRITGGEPLVRKGLVSLVEQISSLEQIQDLALTTNGVLLKKYAKDLKNAGLNRVNISMDTLNKEKYRDITRGGELKTVLNGIEEAKKVGLFPIKLNVVVIGGFNDDEIIDFAKLTMEENIEVRFIELMPIGQASKWAKKNFLSNIQVKNKFAKLTPVYEGDKSSPAQYFRLPEGKGKIGFINPISKHFCKYCNRIRLTADGRLKPCLHSDREIDVKSILRKGKLEEDLKSVIESAIMEKPNQHTLNEKNNRPIERDMVRIGG